MQSGPDSGDMILRAPQALLKQKLQVNMLNIALKPVLNSETRVQWVDIYLPTFIHPGFPRFCQSGVLTCVGSLS